MGRSYDFLSPRSDNIFYPFSLGDKNSGLMRNHVKVIHIVNSCRGLSKGTVLCGGY